MLIIHTYLTQEITPAYKSCAFPCAVRHIGVGGGGVGWIAYRDRVFGRAGWPTDGDGRRRVR